MIDDDTVKMAVLRYPTTASASLAGIAGSLGQPRSWHDAFAARFPIHPQHGGLSGTEHGRQSDPAQ